MALEEELTRFLRGVGIELFSAGTIKEIKKEFPIAKEVNLEGIDYAISIAYPLLDQVLEGIVDQPTLLYKHLYRQVNNLLDRGALLCARFLEDKGAKAIPIPASQILDWRTNLAHLSHRQVAVELGMGFYGRNNLLVMPDYGSRVRLVTILTDLPIEVPGPLKAQPELYSKDCGACYNCVSVCPAQAIHKSVLDFDRKACFSKVKEFEKMPGIGVGICGVCVRACRGPK